MIKITHLEDYRIKVAKLAHEITGQYLKEGKIDQYITDRHNDIFEYKIHFADNGFWLCVEIKLEEV